MRKEGRRSSDQPVCNGQVKHSDCQWLCAGKLARLCLQPDLELVVEKVLSVAFQWNIFEKRDISTVATPYNLHIYQYLSSCKLLIRELLVVR
jgi:hypothetical protein